MVAPGGRIIYITCSVLASEGADQIDRFLRDAPDLEAANIGDIPIRKARPSALAQRSWEPSAPSC